MRLSSFSFKAGLELAAASVLRLWDEEEDEDDEEEEHDEENRHGN
jgi:hypothetical protein